MKRSGVKDQHLVGAISHENINRDLSLLLKMTKGITVVLNEAQRTEGSPL